uniref:ELM2 domain-containing protein n=1 Tax=Parastrongyloides trichosuri TaxID=131310 RepID=A0A0N4Z1Y6_PARTI
MSQSSEASTSKEKFGDRNTLRTRRSRRLGDSKGSSNDIDDPNFDTVREREAEKIHIGPLFQADIPEMLKQGEEDAMYDKFKNMEILWDPKKVPEEDLTEYDKMKLDGFLLAAEAYGIAYTDSLELLAEKNYDPMEACREIESFTPYHYIKPFTKEEIKAYNSMLKYTKEKRYKMIAQKIGRPLNEVMAYHYSMRKRTCHKCKPDTKICTCFTVKKYYGENIVKDRKDCINCSKKYYNYNDNDILPVKLNEIGSLKLCKPCEIYMIYTGNYRKPVLEYTPPSPTCEDVDMEEKVEIEGQESSGSDDNEESVCFYTINFNEKCSSYKRPHFPDSHMVSIIHEITNCGSDKEAILQSLEMKHNITQYTREDIEYFITFYSLDYNIPFLIEVANTRRHAAAANTMTPREM